jgi:hypothetical protein
MTPPWVIEVVSAIVESALLGTSKLVSRCLIALLRSWQQPTTDCVAWGSRNQCAAPNSEVIGEGRCSIADCGEWITYKNIAISSVKSIQGFTLSKRLDGLGFRR